jgi:hypothetical protein
LCMCRIDWRFAGDQFQHLQSMTWADGHIMPNRDIWGGE